MLPANGNMGAIECHSMITGFMEEQPMSWTYFEKLHNVFSGFATVSSNCSSVLGSSHLNKLWDIQANSRLHWFAVPYKNLPSKGSISTQTIVRLLHLKLKSLTSSA